MSNATEAAQALEQASQKHEKEIVIEFGPDRILQYIGVYLVAFLAVIAKISELAASNLSCHPAGNFSASGDFISYATAYCWESTTVVNPDRLASGDNSSTCKTEALTPYEDNMLRNPSFFKTFTRLLPYAMIFEAVLFCLPSVWWHIRVGAKLMGHLKFMKLLLNDIYETVKPIPTGIYKTDNSYDCDSYYLDGWRGFQPNYKKKGELTDVKAEPGCCGIGGKKSSKLKNRRLEMKGDNTKTTSLIENQQQQESKGQSSESEATRDETARDKTAQDETTHEHPNGKQQESKAGYLAQMAFGGMKDRHLFSMLCFENFSSLEHHPYILSVYKLSATPIEPSDKGFIGSKMKGILRLLCNKNNFGGRFLVKSYLLRHLLGTMVAVAVLTATGLVLRKIGLEGWNAESFRCDIIYHLNVCMICTIRRKLDMIALLFVNLCITVLYLATSFYQLIHVRCSSNRATSHYFEEISDTGSAALRRA